MASSTAADAPAYIAETRYALERLFETLGQRQRVFAQIAEEVSSIDDEKDLHQGIFMDRDQWSHNANWHYVRYVETLESLNEARRELLSDRVRQDRMQQLLARLGATGQAMEVLAGSVLQLAKQTLSFRFGAKGNVPSGSLLGSQPITGVIWEGRNHAMHWEEGRKGTPAHNMLLTLQADGLASVQQNKNNSLAILDALGWSSADEVVSSLEHLVK